MHTFRVLKGRKSDRIHGCRARFSGFALVGTIPRNLPVSGLFLGLRHAVRPSTAVRPLVRATGAARDQAPGGLNPTDFRGLSPMGFSPASFSGSASQTGDYPVARPGLEPATSSGRLRPGGDWPRQSFRGCRGRLGTAGAARDRPVRGRARSAGAWNPAVFSGAVAGGRARRRPCMGLKAGPERPGAPPGRPGEAPRGGRESRPGDGEPGYPFRCSRNLSARESIF